MNNAKLILGVIALIMAVASFWLEKMPWQIPTILLSIAVILP